MSDEQQDVTTAGPATQAPELIGDSAPDELPVYKDPRDAAMERGEIDLAGNPQTPEDRERLEELEKYLGQGDPKDFSHEDKEKNFVLAARQEGIADEEIRELLETRRARETDPRASFDVVKARTEAEKALTEDNKWFAELGIIPPENTENATATGDNPAASPGWEQNLQEVRAIGAEYGVNFDEHGNPSLAEERQTLLSPQPAQGQDPYASLRGLEQRSGIPAEELAEALGPIIQEAVGPAYTSSANAQFQLRLAEHGRTDNLLPIYRKTYEDQFASYPPAVQLGIVSDPKAWKLATQLAQLSHREELINAEARRIANPGKVVGRFTGEAARPSMSEGGLSPTLLAQARQLRLSDDEMKYLEKNRGSTR